MLLKTLYLQEHAVSMKNKICFQKWPLISDITIGLEAATKTFNYLATKISCCIATHFMYVSCQISAKYIRNVIDVFLIHK